MRVMDVVVVVVERRTRGLRPSHSRFSKGAMNHGRLEGKTSEKKEDEERTTRRKKWSTHESTIPDKNKRAPTVILNRHEGKKNRKVKGTNKKTSVRNVRLAFLLFFSAFVLLISPLFGCCCWEKEQSEIGRSWFLNTVVVRRLLLPTRAWNSFTTKKKSVWLSPSVSTVKKIKFKSLTKQKKPSSS